MKWLATVLCFIASVGLADIIPADRLVPWSTNMCGIPGGIPLRTNIYKTLSPGDDIQANLNLCPFGQVVLLTNNTFTITTPLIIPSGVTLRGLGMNETILQGYAPTGVRTGLVTMGILPGNKTAWLPIASGATNGSTNVVLSSSDTKIAVGAIVYIDELNSSWLVSNGGAGGTKNDTDDRGGGVPGTHNVSQQVEIKQVVGGSGNKSFNFYPPLMWNYTNQPSMFYRYNDTSSVSNYSEWAGVESLTIRNTKTTTSGVGSGNNLAFCTAKFCWAKDVFSRDASVCHFWLERSYGLEIRGCTISNTMVYTSSGGYGLLLEQNSCSLVEDNIFVHMRDFIKCELGSSYNAILYNYMTDPQPEIVGTTPSTFASHTGVSHSPHPMMNLFEGNITFTPTMDFFWGSASHFTFVRNWFKGPVSWCRNNRRALCIDERQQFNNVVGNVLGASYQLTNSHCYSLSISPSQTWIKGTDYVTFLIGYHDIDSPGYGTADGSQLWANTIAAGNYDFVAGQTNWYYPTTVEAIPDSFFYTNKPYYFGTNAWPPFSPDPLRYSETAIPAGYRYVNHSNPPIQVLTISPQGASNSYPNCVQYTATVDFGSGVTTNVSSSSTWTVTDYLLGIPNPAVSVTASGLACISNSAQYRININAAWSNLTAVSTLTVTNTQPTPNTNPIVCNLQWWAPRIFGYSGCAPSGLPSVFTNYMLTFVTSPECTIAGDFEGSLFFSDNVPKTSHTFTFSTNSIDALIGLLPSPKRIHFDLQCTSTNGGVTVFPFGSIPLGCPTEINGAVLWNPGNCLEGSSMTVMY